jgi:hypothetical protein
MLQPTLPPGRFAGDLLVRSGPGKGVCHPLAAAVTLVGRGPECDLRVGDLTVRLAHCVLAHAPDGIHLRSLGGPTIVNGLPTLARTLGDGDVIALGPVELQVRFKPLVPDDPPPANRKSAPWREHLARGRARLLRERAALREDFARNLQALAVGRAEADDARAAAAAERERLRDLRRRFIRRWRSHWADERARVTAERQVFAAEIERLTRERDEARRDRAVSAEHLDRREAELARREAEQDARRADLEQELAGLEARIAHARAALPTGPIVAVATPDVPDVPDFAARRRAVERAAAEVEDQRRALVEHLRDIALVQAGERETADLLTDLVEDIGRLEAAAVADRAALDAWHARLVLREGEVERREVDVAGREERVERDEEALNQLAARWTSLRRAEEARVTADLDLATLLRGRAAAAPVPAEAESLADLFRATAERLALLVYREQELADREVDAARREIDARAAADVREVESFRRQAALAQADRQLSALRDEVQRLAGYADRAAGPALRVA